MAQIDSRLAAVLFALGAFAAIAKDLPFTVVVIHKDWNSRGFTLSHEPVLGVVTDALRKIQ